MEDTAQKRKNTHYKVDYSPAKVLRKCSLSFMHMSNSIAVERA